MMKSSTYGATPPPPPPSHVITAIGAVLVMYRHVRQSGRRAAYPGTGGWHSPCCESPGAVSFEVLLCCLVILNDEPLVTSDDHFAVTSRSGTSIPPALAQEVALTPRKGWHGAAAVLLSKYPKSVNVKCEGVKMCACKNTPSCKRTAVSTPSEVSA
jgi:hypothetical protein